MGEPVEVAVEGRRVRLTNLDKVLYPAAGFTKAEVVDYYVRIADAMLPHLRDRCVTFRRFPNGVDGTSFFEKRCPSHRPGWVDTAAGPGDRGGPIQYCLIAERAGLAWAANLAALELHTPMARSVDLESPQMVVFDLDPGEGTTIVECAALALRIREMLDAIGLVCVAKTSGSKGMQVYVPLNAPHTHEQAADFALAVAQVLERAEPTKVTTTMAKAVRPGRVFVDWSQNSRHKTTVCVYSLRARPTPTVSTPVAWDEVADAAVGMPLTFTATDVLARVDRDGDLFAAAVEMVQHLPVV